jgi:hypothetical protein
VVGINQALNLFPAGCAVSFAVRAACTALASLGWPSDARGAGEVAMGALGNVLLAIAEQGHATRHVLVGQSYRHQVGAMLFFKPLDQLLRGPRWRRAA